MEENIRELEERESANQQKDIHTLEVIPDDTDDLMDEAEIQAWKQREIARIMRSRVQEAERIFVRIREHIDCRKRKKKFGENR